MTTDDTSLTCQTDSTTCCRAVDNPSSSMGTGEWLFPNGMEISRRNSITSNGFYWIRYHHVVRLYRQGDIQTPLGTYCCRIPDSGGEMRTFCANLIGEVRAINSVNYVNPTANTIRCPSDSVMVPINGTVSYSSPEEGGNYAYGTVATFSCSLGFGLSTLETRTCTGANNAETGTFNGSSPTCNGEYQNYNYSTVFIKFLQWSIALLFTKLSMGQSVIHPLLKLIVTTTKQ